MRKEDLLELRKLAVESAEKLAVAGSGSVENRLRILVDMITNGDASIDASRKAYELAESIEDDDRKLDVLLDIIYGIDQNIAKMFDTNEVSVEEK